MKQLSDEYSVQSTEIDSVLWKSASDGFPDMNLYQSWPYEAVRVGEGSVYRCILRRGTLPVALAQARLIRVPLVPLGVAYVRWGPVWRRGGGRTTIDDLRQMLRALRNELVGRKHLILRLYPYLFEDDDPAIARAFEAEGFRRRPLDIQRQTLVIDLSQSLEDLRMAMKPKWRNQLKRAEREPIAIVDGTSDELFGEFVDLYRQMLARKQFREPNNIAEFRRVQQQLDDHEKLRVILARHEGRVAAGAIVSAFGERGTYLFGATNELGLTSRASYPIQWWIIKWLKDRGCAVYDLHGISRSLNPGVHHFKSGLAGKGGMTRVFQGYYESSPTAVHRVLFHSAERVRSLLA